MERNQYKRHTKVNGKEPHFIERGKYENMYIVFFTSKKNVFTSKQQQQQQQPGLPLQAITGTYAVVFRNFNAKHIHVANEGRQAGLARSPTAPDPDQECIATHRAQHATYAHHVRQGIFKQDQVHGDQPRFNVVILQSFQTFVFQVTKRFNQLKVTPVRSVPDRVGQNIRHHWPTANVFQVANELVGQNIEREKKG